jgi:hypothetical protein
MHIATYVAQTLPAFRNYSHKSPDAVVDQKQTELRSSHRFMDITGQFRLLPATLSASVGNAAQSRREKNSLNPALEGMFSILPRKLLLSIQIPSLSPRSAAFHIC